MRPLALYGATSTLLIAVIAGVALVITEGQARQAVFVSALVALVVQLITFGVARSFPPNQVMVGWGLGSLMRVMVLVLYAFFVAKLWHAPLMPALISLVSFLFVTTVIEPIFLRR